MVKEITVHELHALMDEGKKPVLVDVRETHELDICKLPYDHHIPVGQLSVRYSELDSAADIVIYCRSGGRSGMACETLQAFGFTNVRNLVGGVLAWGREIDPSFREY